MKRRNVATVLMTLICLGIAAFFIWMIVGTELEYKKGDDAYDLIEELADADDERTSEDPESSSDPNAEENVEETAKNINFDALDAELTGNTVGWLYLPDSFINYPVMQSDDNSYTCITWQMALTILTEPCSWIIRTAVTSVMRIP